MQYGINEVSMAG